MHLIYADLFNLFLLVIFEQVLRIYCVGPVLLSRDMTSRFEMQWDVTAVSSRYCCSLFRRNYNRRAACVGTTQLRAIQLDQIRR